MSAEKSQTPTIYEIRVLGCLDSSWSEWFEGLAVTVKANGEMVLRGSLPDQAALFGVLIKVRDLGLPLLAVNRIQLDTVI